MTPTSVPVPVHRGSGSHYDLPAMPDALRELVPDLEIADPMNAPSIRWGIIGAGGIARTFARDVPAHTRSTISAIGARDLARARGFATEFDIPTAFGSYQELVESDQVDAVYVATPHSFHHSHALMALRAGKPVLVEKAFTANARQATAVIETAHHMDLPLMEAMWSRHLPHWRVIRQIVRSGALGDVVQVHADHGQSLMHVQRLLDPALAGGALLDLGVYPISFAHMVLGTVSRVRASGVLLDTGVDLSEVVVMESGPTHLGHADHADMHSLGRAEHPSSVEDTTRTHAAAPVDTTATGRPATAVATAAFNGRSATYGEVTFTRGALEMPAQFYRPGVLRLRTFPEGGPEDGLTVDWDATVPGGFQYQAAEFARMMAEGRTESDVVSWVDSLQVMEIMDAVRAELGVCFPFE